jgi:hypothetical protein
MGHDLHSMYPSWEQGKLTSSCSKSCLCAKPDPANLEPGEVARKLRLRSTCYPAHRRTIHNNYGFGRNSAACCKAARRKLAATQRTRKCRPERVSAKPSLCPSPAQFLACAWGTHACGTARQSKILSPALPTHALLRWIGLSVALLLQSVQLLAQTNVSSQDWKVLGV